MPKHPVLRPSRIKWTLWVTWAVAAFTLGLVLWLVSARQADQRNQDGLRATVDNLSTLAAQNQVRLGKLGEHPVGPPAASVSAGKATPPPTDIAPVTPGPTKTITVGPTRAQVRAGVDAYFADNPVRPPRITAQQLAPLVTRYVTQYLREHPPARGPAGKPGPVGSPGSPGAVGLPGQPGPSGAPASEEQIASAVGTYLPAAVAAYMQAHPAPAGPSGSTGPSGPPGPPGQPGPSGPSGPPGSPGKDATPEQIGTAVADYINANGVPCPDGTRQSDVPVPGQNLLTPGPTIRACVLN